MQIDRFFALNPRGLVMPLATEPPEPQKLPLAQKVVQGTFILALLVNFALDFFIFREYRSLVHGLEEFEEFHPHNLTSLLEEVHLQYIASLAVSVLLLICMGATWWLRRQYLNSQQSLRETKMLAHDILAIMERGVVTTDRHGVITSINVAAKRMLETSSPCVGGMLDSIAPAELPLSEIYREVTEKHAPVFDRDFRMDRRGRVQRIRVDGHAMLDNQRKYLGCVIHLRDVTERMLLEEKMRRMERFMHLATLASGLHHEIKNPLTAMSIHIQLLEENLARREAGESVEETVDILKTEIQRLNGVLESFRTFANLQNLTFLPTDALEIIDNTIRLIRPQANEQQVQVVFAHPAKAIPLVELDGEKFGQAVLNLVINALEAMPQGGKLTISTVVADGDWRVSIQDTGHGIPLEVQQHLFQPYFSTKSRGSGMGLALTEKIISQHGGRIQFRTSPEGTTFELAIPLQQRDATHERQEFSHPDRG
jgi:two-component system sensor histidine kinase HydH